MKKDNYKKGRQGEQTALDYLTARGYVLVARNYKNELGEIDLIMRDGRRLVFVEVKCKYEDNFGLPEEMIGRPKIKRVKRIAGLYISEQFKGKVEPGCRLDAVCLVMDKSGKPKRISHYENL